MLSLNHKPRFASDRKVILLDQKVYIIAPRQTTVHRAPATIALCQHIDGKSKVTELLDKLASKHAEPELLYRLQQLLEHGHIELQQTAPPVGANDILDHWRQDLQMQFTQTAGQAISLFFLSDPFNQDAIIHLRESWKAGERLILAHPYGETPWLSTPLGQGGPCPFCLLFWLRHNRPMQRFLGRQRQAVTLHPGHPKPANQQVLNTLLEQLLTRLQQDMSNGWAKLIAWDASHEGAQSHTLQQRPQCGLCGNPGWLAEQASQSLQLRQGAIATQSAGLRSEKPGQTYQRLSHLISPLCGPVAYLHPMPGRHADSRYVYAAGYLNCPKQLSGANDFDKLCAGKGDHSEQARTSALCETIERFSGQYQGDEPRKRSRQADLTEPSYGFDALQLFSARQKARRSQINQTTSDPRKQIPLGFDPYSLIDWTPAWSLSNKQHVWVPLGYCYAEAPLQSGIAFGIHNPNGSAAGSHLDEAILQGLLELIERDAVAIWWYNRLLRPKVDLADFAIPYWNTLAAEYADQDYDFWVLDLTHDLATPCFTAIAQHRQQAHYAIGFGCHLDHRIAINRAITELNQLFDPGANRINPWNQDLLVNSDFLHPDPAQTPRRRTDYVEPTIRSTTEVLEFCTRRIEQQSMEVLVVNKSRPDLGLKVAQVVIPGLRHFWPRFGPGRLYDVPMKLGWRQTALAEGELNPALLFL